MTALLVFARAPVAGAVKTRLAATEGAQRALAVYRSLLEATLACALVEGFIVALGVGAPQRGGGERDGAGDQKEASSEGNHEDTILERWADLTTPRHG